MCVLKFKFYDLIVFAKFLYAFFAASAAYVSRQVGWLTTDLRTRVTSKLANLSRFVTQFAARLFIATHASLATSILRDSHVSSTRMRPIYML